MSIPNAHPHQNADEAMAAVDGVFLEHRPCLPVLVLPQVHGERWTREVAPDGWIRETHTIVHRYGECED